MSDMNVQVENDVVSNDNQSTVLVSKSKVPLKDRQKHRILVHKARSAGYRARLALLKPQNDEPASKAFVRCEQALVKNESFLEELTAAYIKRYNEQPSFEEAVVAVDELPATDE